MLIRRKAPPHRPPFPPPPRHRELIGTCLDEKVLSDIYYGEDNTCTVCYRCKNGRQQVQQCPTSFLFNRNAGECEYRPFEDDCDDKHHGDDEENDTSNNLRVIGVVLLLRSTID